MTVKGRSTVKELRGEAILQPERISAPRKTINRSRSFGHAVRDYHQLGSAVATFTAQAAVKLRAQHSVCGAIVTYLKTRQHSDTYHSLAAMIPLGEPSADAGCLITAALEGLTKVYDADSWGVAYIRIALQQI